MLNIYMLKKKLKKKIVLNKYEQEKTILAECRVCVSDKLRKEYNLYNIYIYIDKKIKLMKW